MPMEIAVQDVMFYFYLLIAISIQLAVLFVYPFIVPAKDRALLLVGGFNGQCGFGQCMFTTIFGLYSTNRMNGQ